jgi:hypothetical protein
MAQMPKTLAVLGTTSAKARFARHVRIRYNLVHDRHINGIHTISVWVSATTRWMGDDIIFPVNVCVCKNIQELVGCRPDHVLVLSPSHLHSTTLHAMGCTPYTMLSDTVDEGAFSTTFRELLSTMYNCPDMWMAIRPTEVALKM